VLEAVFVLLESSSPSRRIFIGSQSLPPPLVCCIGPSKREKMLYIDDKAKIVVKLIEDWWHVINFVPDHNHGLVLKPSLKSS
jgi:hypothetical protein